MNRRRSYTAPLWGVPNNAPSFGRGCLLFYNYTFDGSSNIVAIDDMRPTDQIPLGIDRTTRHNTQVFEYDDLYRLTQYTISNPVAHDIVLAQLKYNYDRIGNMLLKTSPAIGEPGHIDHDSKGLTVVNLGEMRYGDSAGRIGRVGRTPGDPPGPHALTSTEDGRVITYDNNGNMETLEGATLTWDFKDRLVRYQKGNTDAYYTYDYTDRRIIKSVTTSETSVVQYIDKLFEIRKYETPTKYAFAGDTRIARFTKFMNRVLEKTQWLHLKPGWNFVSLYVEPDGGTTSNVFDLGGQVSSVWYYDGTQFVNLGIGASVSIARAYMVYADSETILEITGRPFFFNPVTLGQGTTGLGWQIPRGMNPSKDLVDYQDKIDAVWSYLEDSTIWQGWFPNQPSYLSNLTATTRPGTANFITLTTQIELSFSRTRSEDIRFYHGDHLGSSNVVTDGNGKLIEETVFYPFGFPRNQFVVNNEDFIADYRFTGKEQDEESDLQYFEARYLAGHLGRFVSVDPISERIF